MFIQNINMVITGFEVKFKHEIIRWKVNGSVPYVLKIEFRLPGIHTTEVQNQRLFPGTFIETNRGLTTWGDWEIQ